jgi:APA family basic amino acid/polyamine antiporter
MTTPVNKVRDPARTIPRSILIGTLLVAILYLFSSTSVTLLLPADQVAGSTAPYADAIATKWGSAAAAFAALCIAVSAIGCMNAGVLACGELGLAMSLGGDLPKWLSTTTAAGTPVASQLLGSLLGVVMVMLNSSRGFAGLFTFIILLATASTLLLYFVGALAALKKPQTSLGRIVIGIGLLFALFAFWGAGAEALAWNLVLLVIGFALRFVIRFSSRGSTPAPAPAPAVPREPSA